MNWSYIMNIALATLCASLIAVAGATLLHGIEIQKINKYIDRKIGTPDDDSLSLQNKIVIKQNETIIKRIDDMTLWMKDSGSDIDDMTKSDIVNANCNCEEIQKDCELLKQALAQKIISEIKSETLKEFKDKFGKNVLENHYMLTNNECGGKGYGLFTMDIDIMVEAIISEMDVENGLDIFT